MSVAIAAVAAMTVPVSFHPFACAHLANLRNGGTSVLPIKNGEPGRSGVYVSSQNFFLIRAHSMLDLGVVVLLASIADRKTQSPKRKEAAHG